MTNRYFDLIDQTFYFPQEGFDIDKGYLEFNGIPLKYLIEKYKTPLKLTYLPKIGSQIKKARNWFNRAIKTAGYKGKYYYCYCTKSCHFSFVLNEVLQQGVNLETSSAFDLHIIRRLFEEGKVQKDTIILHNGFKPKAYMEGIVQLIQDGFVNAMPICDNMDEVDYYLEHMSKPFNIGVRIATEEEPNFGFYTSRLGIRNRDILPYYQEKIAGNDKVKLKMLHFFVDKGIRDTIYYWGELNKAIKTYCELKKVCPDLEALNIGGGLPIRNTLGFEFDYKYMIQEIIINVQKACAEEGIPEPDIYTEFGRYTVGESGAILFSVIGQKQQNDSELWYMIDNSLMSTIPDSWSLGERFILLPINYWEEEYRRVNIGGLSCDNSDYYNSEVHESQVFLPSFDSNAEEPLYLGFFHTGAYQDALAGYGGIQHCLIPKPKQVILYKDDRGNLVDVLYREEQQPEEMIRVLGY